MAEYLSPGVYVEEFESGSRPMTGVSTSVAGFLGIAQKGPTEGAPVLVTNYADYVRTFGGYLPESTFHDFRFMPYAVEQFFQNGGSRCYVVRVDNKCSKCAYRTFNRTETGGTVALMTIEAKNKGSWGNNISIQFTVVADTTNVLARDTADTYLQVKNAAAFKGGDTVALITLPKDESNVSEKVIKYSVVKKTDDTSLYFGNADLKDKVIDKIGMGKLRLEIKFDGISEVYEDVSFNMESSSFISKKLENSELVYITSINPQKIQECIVSDNHLLKWMSGNDDDIFKFMLDVGSDGCLANFSDQSKLANAFKGSSAIPDKKTGLAAFTDNDIVSLICIPGITDKTIQQEVVTHCELLGNRFAILDMPKNKKAAGELIEFRNDIDSSYAAMYHPWIQSYDGLDKITATFPPSGAVAGVYSRTDQERGVHKAPANEIIRNTTGLDCIYNSGEQAILNPAGINLIRSFPGMGIRVWGARTCSSNSLWRYINVRRLFIYLEESIKASTNWVVFEPNDELLWIRVKRTIEVFLGDVWRTGALAGSTSEEAFYVEIGRTTMTQSDIDNGRLICIIGVAPVKPAEFVIFRLTQKTMSE